MRFNPGEILAKLQDMGISVDLDNPLRKKCREERERGRLKPPIKGDDKKSIAVDYTPSRQGIKGRPLQEVPKEYIIDVLNFVGYISDTAKRSFKITMKNVITGEGFVKWKPYIHRWTEVYKKGILAKFYALEAYLTDNPKPATMITLSCSTRNKTYEQVMSEIDTGRKKVLDLLRWKFGTQDYFWVKEPHKSGFVHLHLAYFYPISEVDQVSLKALWSEKYGYGSFENGIDFSLPRASLDGTCAAGAISSIRNYSMKYLAKGLHSSPSTEIEIMGRKVPLEMSLGELLFNSILKKMKSRLWGCSRFFSKIMKRPEKEGSKDWECIEVDQLYEPYQEDESLEERTEHFMTVLWTKEGGLRPDSVKKWELIKSLSSLNDSDIEEAKFNDYKIESSPISIINKRGVKVGELPNYNLYRPIWCSIGG